MDSPEPMRVAAISDRNFRRLLKRLRPGMAVVMDAPDFDTWTAARLLEGGAAAVINASESISGRTPSVGAPLLVDNGVVVVDRVGVEILDELQQGETMTIEGRAVSLGGGVRLEGVRLTPELIAGRLQMTQGFIAVALSKMASAVTDRNSSEWGSFFQAAHMPEVEAILRGRLTAVVMPGSETLPRLRKIRRRLFHCALVAAEGGCDALKRLDLAPHVLVGRSERLSDAELLAGAKVVLLDPTDGDLARCAALGVTAIPLHWPGSAEEAAMVVAAENGARLVLAVGPAYEFSEVAGRSDSAVSTAIITRLRLGPRVMDVETLHRLIPGFHPPFWAWGLLIATSLVLLWVIARAIELW